MFAQLRNFIFIGLAGLLLSSSAQANFKVPPLTGPVVDRAGVLSSDVNAALTNALQALNQQKHTQIQVLIVQTLDGEYIEQASIQVTDAWKIGQKKTDRGVLLMLAIGDRKARIEVGRGLEGDIPDILAKRIIADDMTPYLQQNDYNAAVTLGVYKIAKLSDPDFDFKSYLQNTDLNDESPRSFSGKQVIVFIVFMLIIIFLGHVRGGRGGWGGGGFGSGWGSGGFGGGGFGGSSGGGSWGGGGGGFSGGGASGGW